MGSPVMPGQGRVPDVRRVIFVCLTCRHWQCDIRPGAVSDLGGAQQAFNAIAQAHIDHQEDCPGAGGRIKVFEQWIDPPDMSDGKRPDGSMELHVMPPWWVAK